MTEILADRYVSPETGSKSVSEAHRRCRPWQEHFFMARRIARSATHMVEGKGGRVGPELTAVGGSRTREAIMDSVRNPSRRLA